MEYIEEHGSFLGDADFRWCPEGLREEDAALLGDVTGLRVLDLRGKLDRGGQPDGQARQCRSMGHRAVPRLGLGLAGL